MFSVLVFIAGSVIAEAGTYKPNGFNQHYHPVSGHSVRSVVVRPQFAKPGLTYPGLSPALSSHSPVLTSTFFSPTLFKSAYISNAALIPQFRPMPISHAAIGPISTITHVSPPVVLNSFEPSLTTYVSSPELNSLPISHVSPAAINHLPSPTVFTSAPINHALAVPELVKPQNTLKYIPSSKVKEVQELPEKSISYTLSEQDYLYLKKHKIEGEDSPFNPVLGHDISPTEKHQNPHSHNESHNDKGKDVSNPPLQSLDSDVLKRSAVPKEAYSGFAEPIVVDTPEPVIVKHIYFHVPQPDFEEPPAPRINLPPPKKTYNILFIKAPTQESQNRAYLQQLQNMQPRIEDKTLIYVLSKKQDPVQIVVPPQEIRPSSPEVYFVKYQTKSGEVDIRHNLAAESVIESISPVIDRKRSVEKKSESQPEKDKKQKTKDFI